MASALLRAIASLILSGGGGGSWGTFGRALGAGLLGVGDRTAVGVRTLDGVVAGVTRDLEGVDGGLSGVRVEDECGARDMSY